MTYIKKEQQNTAEDDGECNPCRDDLLTKQLHPAGEEHQAQAKQEKTTHIETASWGGEVRHIFAGIKQPRDANRNINQEDPVPACPGDEYPAENRTQYGADQAGHRDEVEHRKQFTARIGAQ